MIRDTVIAKNEVATIYTWYRTLSVYIKPEEEAIAAAKERRQYERLEKTKNIQFDENFKGMANGGMKPLILGRVSVGKGMRTIDAKSSAYCNKDLQAGYSHKKRNVSH